jgi:hypothetical protein
MNGMRNLFSDQEFKFYESYKSMSTLAQTIFARTITRKRIWYVVDDHLSSYAPDKAKEEIKEKDLDQLQEAMVQLIECSLFETEESIFMELSN